MLTRLVGFMLVLIIVVLSIFYSMSARGQVLGDSVTPLPDGISVQTNETYGRVTVSWNQRSSADTIQVYQYDVWSGRGLMYFDTIPGFAGRHFVDMPARGSGADQAWMMWYGDKFIIHEYYEGQRIAEHVLYVVNQQFPTATPVSIISAPIILKEATP